MLKSFAQQNFYLPILSRNLYNEYPQDLKFQNFEYAVLLMNLKLPNNQTKDRNKIGIRGMGVPYKFRLIMGN
jgi:hypothetical protein